MVRVGAGGPQLQVEGGSEPVIEVTLKFLTPTLIQLRVGERNSTTTLPRVMGGPLHTLVLGALGSDGYTGCLESLQFGGQGPKGHYLLIRVRGSRKDGSKKCGTLSPSSMGPLQTLDPVVGLDSLNQVVLITLIAATLFVVFLLTFGMVSRTI